jgi:hypothetical protein
MSMSESAFHFYGVRLSALLLLEQADIAVRFFSTAEKYGREEEGNTEEYFWRQQVKGHLEALWINDF